MASLTHEQLAAKLGVAQSLVSRYRREGMPTDGVLAARAWIKANKRARAKPADAKRPDAIAPNGYMASRIQRERAEAEMAQLRVLEARRDLVSGSKVREELARRLAGLRDSLLQIPPRLQSVLAAETDEAKCHDILQDELYLVLAQFADVAAAT